MGQPRTKSEVGLDEERLANILGFLKENRSYNQHLQNRTYKRWLRHCEDRVERLFALLFNCASTQSQAKLDKLGECWRTLYQNRELAYEAKTVPALSTFLLENLPSKKGKPRKSTNELFALWSSLRRLQGWGDKTAALFVKALVEIHTDPENEGLRFLPKFRISEDSRLHLPVDAVIKHIFRSHLTNHVNLSFKEINIYVSDLSESYMDSIAWDDLWFWGFLTQRVEHKVRRTELNMSKFWCLWDAPWAREQEVRAKANEFLGKLNS